MASKFVVLGHDSIKLVTRHSHVVKTAIVGHFTCIVNRFQRVVVS